MEGEDFSSGSVGHAAAVESPPFGTERSHDAVMQHSMEQNGMEMEGSRPPSRRGSNRGSAAPSLSSSTAGPPSSGHQSFSQDRPPSRQASRAASVALSQSPAPEAAEGSLGDMPSLPSKQSSRAESLRGRRTPSVHVTPEHSQRELSAAEDSGSPRERLLGKSRSSRSGSAAGTPEASQENMDPEASIAAPPSKDPSKAGSVAGSLRSASRAPSSAQGNYAQASMEDLHAIPAAPPSSKGSSRAGSVLGSPRSTISKAPSARGSRAMSREPSVAMDPSFVIPAAAQAPAEDLLQLPVAQDGGDEWHEEPPAAPSPSSSAVRRPKASRTPKEVAPRSPEWCLQMFGDGMEITREDLTGFLQEYCQDGRVLKLPAHEFNHMDFDCNGSLNRDEFYFFFYGWLAHKIPVEEEVYHNPRLREEAHQLCWIFEVYRCVSALSLDMTLRPWLTLCTDAGLLSRLHFEKKDAEMIFKKTIRASCNASGVEPRAGIGYMEFLEALRLISAKKQVSFADIIEDVLFVGASHRTNLDRNRFRDLASSSLTPMVDSTIKEPTGEFHAALTEELYQPGTRSVSFHADRVESPTRRTVRSTGQATSFYNNLQWNGADALAVPKHPVLPTLSGLQLAPGRSAKSDSTWRRKKSTGITVTRSMKDTTPLEAPPAAAEAFSGFEATVPAPLSEENVKVSERETELELQLADMTSQRDQGNEAMARMEERLWEMEERMARLAGENGALMDRVSRLEVRAKDAEDGKQAAHEYIALLEQNLAIASASAVANAQSNEEIMAGLQKKAEELNARSPNRASIMEHLTKRREARRGLVLTETMIQEPWTLLPLTH